jgi:hypothetical protein
VEAKQARMPTLPAQIDGEAASVSPVCIGKQSSAKK